MEEYPVEEEGEVYSQIPSSTFNNDATGGGSQLVCYELTEEEMEELTGGDPEMVQMIWDIQRQGGIMNQPLSSFDDWKEFLLKNPTHSSEEDGNRSSRNFSKSPSKSKKPKKSFAEMVKEEEAKEAMIGDTGRKKTMDDFDYKPPSSLKKQQSRNNNYGMIHLVVGTIALLFGVGIGWYSINGAFEFPASNSSYRPQKHSWEWAHKKVLSEIQRLSKAFPSQKQDTLLHILSAINSTLAPQQPKQPSSLVLLVPPKLSSFSQCFALKLAKLTNGIFSGMNATIPPSAFEIDSKYFEKYGQDITHIHSQLHHYFGSGGRSIIIKDVEKIQQEKHLLLFHGLCDNFHAPEKRATLFFILPVPQKLFSSTENKWSNERASELSYKILDNAWKTIVNDDSRPAIISRVAASVVLLNDGDTCSG